MINPLLLTDFYKIGHPFQYPHGTEFVYANLTPRKSRLTDDGIHEMVFFGLQYFVKAYLIETFNRDFFGQPKLKVMDAYRRRIKTALGCDLQSYQHIEALHDLGYLPILIKALPEGTSVPMRVPCLTIVNTLPQFYWLTNFLETILSTSLWQPCTSATLARSYRRLLEQYAEMTGVASEFVRWQGHDFSFRGMSSLESAITSGMAHLTCFTGTDTIPAIEALEQYYNADADKELVGGSVPATEHSVMCAGGKSGERETFRRLITEVYPSGVVSIVSDTWDLWKVLTEIVPSLRQEILQRHGKVVIRPDSGDPVDIICGNPDGKSATERKGVIELLWDTFGGSITETGHKLLDPHVGAIYGDSITPKRAEQICHRLHHKGFASQVVFGIGSYTYQHNTRDTFGTAIKATHVVIGGDGLEISKDPATDDGTKKSATGLLSVMRDAGGRLILKDRATCSEEQAGELIPVFCDGKLLVDDSLASIRERIAGQL